MTTYDYELLDQDPAQLAATICADPATAATLDDDTLRAMLQWAQHNQDPTVYEPCYDETHRRIQYRIAQETERYGLDPVLLAQAQHLAGTDLTEWGDQLDPDQYDAGQRVIAYLLLDPDQFQQAFGTPTAPTITDVIAAFVHAAELFARYGGTDAYANTIPCTDPAVANTWWQRLYPAVDAVTTLSDRAEKRARTAKRTR